MERDNLLKKLLKDESGYGVKEIAITVAVIVIIGFAIGIIQGNLGSWISEIWTIFVDQIKDLIS